MASKQHDALMAALPGGNVDHNDPVDIVREKMHSIHPNSASPGTVVEEADLDGIEAKWIYTQENADSDRIVMHVHGGAFVSTIIDHYLDYGEHLSRHMSAKVVCFQWTWADEAPYPAAMNDTMTAYRALLAQGIDSKRIVLVGDSCGGGIAGPHQTRFGFEYRRHAIAWQRITQSHMRTDRQIAHACKSFRNVNAGYVRKPKQAGKSGAFQNQGRAHRECNGFGPVFGSVVDKFVGHFGERGIPSNPLPLTFAALAEPFHRIQHALLTVHVFGLAQTLLTTARAIIRNVITL